jgi:chromo domain-containing protein 1
VVAEHPPVDYFNRLANSQEDANTHMVGYYAAMQSADMQRAYRYFYVVHTEPEAACAKEWKASIHNIADIITPEQCMEELRKSSKDSLFDFLDWAMEPKEEQSEVEPETEGMGDAPMEMSSPIKEIPTGPVAQ